NTVISVVYSVTKYKEKGVKIAILPLLINVVTIFVLSFSISYSYKLVSYKEEFNINKKSLQEIVSLVESNTLKVDNISTNSPYQYKTIKLPLKYRYLSIGGEVWYEKKGNLTKLFFIDSTDYLYE